MKTWLFSAATTIAFSGLCASCSAPEEGTPVGGTGSGGMVATGGWMTGGNVTGGGETGDATGGWATGGGDTGGWATGGGDTGGGATGGGDTGGSTTGGGETGGSATGGTGGSSGSTELELFSFFVMSMEAIQAAGGAEGLGGDLGGIYGADALCQQAAESVGSIGKTWVAFLSVADDGSGRQIDAIDRIGNGPWYARNGHLLAENKEGLLQTRPAGSTEIVWTQGFTDWPFKDCLTTEFGICNHDYGDSHDILTGSNAQGRLYGTAGTHHCDNWTSTTTVNARPIIGHSWPRQGPGEVTINANWIFSQDREGSPHTPNGCGANINVGNSMEPGIGGSGGYGAWYCFAIVN